MQDALKSKAILGSATKQEQYALSGKHLVIQRNINILNTTKATLEEATKKAGAAQCSFFNICIYWMDVSNKCNILHSERQTCHNIYILY